MARSKPLNSRQKKFVENYVLKGLTISDSYRLAGYVVSSGKVEDYGSKGCRLLKQDRIKDYVSKLREKQFCENALTLSEKRSFLARVVRSDVRNPDPDLVQEVHETQGEHGTSRRVKLVSKMDAIREDNVMAGHRFQDSQDNQPMNFFSFIVGLSKDHAPSLPAVPSLPSAPVIEAEIVP